MSQPTFLASLELIFLQLIELHDLDADSFMQLTGTSSASTVDSKARKSTQAADQLFAKAIALIPDPAFALRAAECWHPSNLGALGFAWLSSATLQEGLDRLIRYSRILGQQSAFHCVKTAQFSRLVLVSERDAAELRATIADFIFSIVIDMCRKNVGSTFNPTLVRLQRQQPLNPAPYTDFFGCKVIFNATENSFEIDRKTADAPLPTSNLELAATLDSILSKQLASLDTINTVARCKHFFLMELTSGEPTEHALAKALGMSLRGLQRKLAEDNTSYSQLFNEVRHELAQNYLSESIRSVNEITFLLGYSEQSAFTRAFKRWHGKSPSDFRAENFTQ